MCLIATFVCYCIELVISPSFCFWQPLGYLFSHSTNSSLALVPTLRHAQLLLSSHGIADVPLNCNITHRLGFGQYPHDALDLTHSLTLLPNSTNSSVNGKSLWAAHCREGGEAHTCTGDGYIRQRESHSDLLQSHTQMPLFHQNALSQLNLYLSKRKHER